MARRGTVKVVGRSKPSKRGRVTVRTKTTPTRRKPRVAKKAVKATSKGMAWWKGLTAAQKKAYLARHPNSRYGNTKGAKYARSGYARTARAGESMRRSAAAKAGYEKKTGKKSLTDRQRFALRKAKRKAAAALKPLRKTATKTKAIRKPRSKRVATPKRAKAAAGIVNIADIAKNFRLGLRSGA